MPKFGRKIEVSSVLVVANKVIQKGIVNRAFQETMFFYIKIFPTKHPSILDYKDVVAKVSIGLRNVN